MKNFRKEFIPVLLGVVLFFSGCASLNKTQKGAIIGTAAGATIGTIVGKTAGILSSI